MWHSNALLFIALSLVLTACPATESKSARKSTVVHQPEEVYRAGQCGRLDFSYDFSASLSEFRQKHPQIPLTDDAASQAGGWLYISLGRQPHPGYRPHWELLDFTVYVSVLPPEPDSFYPQVVTKPCLVLAIPTNWPKPLSILKKS
jgi:hypothetical protein